MDFGADQHQDESAVMIDLTSMIDVLFVLVLFFMVTTTFSDSSSIPLALPKASKTSVESSKRNLTVTISQSGKIIFTDGKSAAHEVTVEALGTELQQLKQAGATLDLVIRADKAVQHGTVVSVLDQAKQSGVEKIAIAAEPNGNP